MNRQKDAPGLIVSVESRKGGVGKTTAALCLGRILRNKGYAVLVLDLDVTGTNAADIADSPFWIDDLHIVQKPDRAGTVAVPLNLIELFDRSFMAGIAIPDFSTQYSTPELLLVDLKKVNVLGSQVYKTGRDPNDRTRLTCLERPSILFDDLHTFWLLELVAQIIDNFLRLARTNSDGKVAVILDNSPGYIGIAPAIHDWLTDRGPQYAKFLIVTSLDIQDMRACGQAIDALHGLYTDKWRTSRLFVEGARKGAGIEVDKNQEPFFMRLASSGNKRDWEADPLSFYRDVDGAASKQPTVRGERFCDHPNNYIAAIINRVPRAVKEGHLFYDYSPVLNEIHGALGRVIGGDEVNSQRERMVSYDEYIENQYLVLKRSRGHRGYAVHRLVDPLKTAEDELRASINVNENDLIEPQAMDYERLKEQLGRADDVVSHARSTVEDAGLGHLARLIRDEWLPGSIVRDFRSVLSTLFRESDFPYFEMAPFEFRGEHAEPEAQDFVMRLKKLIRKELQRSRADFEAHDPQTVDTLVGVLSGLVVLSFGSSLWRTPLREDVAELLAGIAAIELKHWTKRREEKSGRAGIQRFLAQESVSLSEIREDMEVFRPLRFFRNHMMEKGDTNIVRFYKACTSAQARLIDFAADSRFLIQLLRFIVEGEMKKSDLFPFVRGIAEDVIVNKTLRHEDAPARMAKGLQTAEYFREFDQVLMRVLKDWEVAIG
jgi:hypothetical protein